jgi:hypothetical protein
MCDDCNTWGTCEPPKKPNKVVDLTANWKEALHQRDEYKHELEALREAAREYFSCAQAVIRGNMSPTIHETHKYSLKVAKKKLIPFIIKFT